MNHKALYTVLLAMMLTSQAKAQLITLRVEQPQMRSNAMVAIDLDFTHIAFDSKGRYDFASDRVTAKKQAYISLNNTGIYAIAEPGKTLEISVSGSGKLSKVKFKGPNAYESELLNAMQGFYPTKDVYYEENNPQDTLSFPEAWKLLDSKYETICRLLSKQQDKAKADSMQQEADMRYLSNRIQMQQGYCHKYGINTKSDSMLSELMAQVNPNDEKYTANGILQNYIFYKMPIEVSSSTDVNDYASQYLNTVCREINNEKIRDNMLDMHVSQCIQAEGLDIDRFWTLVKEKCSPDIVKTYQYIVYARKSTKSGMMCPDVTFSDIQGKSHRLSDYFGKVLYIDLWATWCGPCCMEIPYLEKLADHYKSDPRIQFISISMDRDHAAWEKKINEDKPAWLQFITSREEDRLLSSQWGVASIPRFLIINADGTICNNDAFRPSTDDFIPRMDAILDNNNSK